MNYPVCFAAYLHRIGRRPGTIRKHSCALRDFTSYCRQTSKRTGMIRSLSPHRLSAYRDHLLVTRGLRPSTVNGRLSSLSAFAAFLLDRGVITYNPLELVDRIKSNGEIKRRAAASWEDVQELRRACERHIKILNLRDQAIVELLYTGITVRELCSLPWEGQDKTDSHIEIMPGRRKLELHQQAEQALQDYLIIRPVLAGTFLIVGHNGADWSLSPAAVYGVVRRLAQRIGSRVAIRDLRLARLMHDLEDRAADSSEQVFAAA